MLSGQSINVELSAVITNTAWFSNFVSVSAATPDPDLSGNTALTGIQGQFFQPENSVRFYGPNAVALAYDLLHQRLFASLSPSGGTNLLAYYDPESGELLGTLPVELAATIMRVTDDGQYLYLAGGSTGLVQRVALSSLTIDFAFTPLQGGTVDAMSIISGSPDSVALTCTTNGVPVTAVYDNGTARPDALTYQPFTILTGSSDGTTLYGYANTGTGGNSPRVFRMAISSSGLQAVDNGPSETPFGSTTVMKYALNQLFFGTGDVIDPSSWTLEQPFTVTNGYYPGNIEPIVPDGVAAFLEDDINNNLSHLGISAISTRNELQQFDIPTSIGGDGNLTWCGAYRLAFIGYTGGIVFVRASSLPSADISVSGAFSTNQIMAGDTVDLEIIVSNAGPYSVTNVYATNSLPNGFNLVAATLSQGSFITNGQTLIFNIGPLNAGTNATLNLAMSLGAALVDQITNSTVVTSPVSAVAIDLPDPIPFNNSTAPQVTMVPRDGNHDGIPDYWDLIYGFDPNDPNVASEDSAGDGISNLQKYLSGLNPFVFYGLNISGWEIAPPTNLIITVHGAVGLTYALQVSADLGRWSNLSTFLCQSTNQQVETPFDPSVLEQFYRISGTTNAPTPIVTVSLSTNGTLVQVAAPPGYTYTVSVSTDQVDWTEWTNFYATDWQTQLLDPETNGYPNRYYEVVP